ncbi:hypothetical protein ACFRAQ_34760 [Nocardia sp. NPDC056611]|uniref:hypothetical protein n=1 Tax=Nocardia sp. NPDC056611 TaxID=3345877 RepID=UPI00366AF1A5
MRKLTGPADLDAMPERGVVRAHTKTGENTLERDAKGRWHARWTPPNGLSSQAVWDGAVEVFQVRPSLEFVDFDNNGIDTVHIQVEFHTHEAPSDDEDFDYGGDSDPNLNPPRLTNYGVPADSDWVAQVREEMLQWWGAEAVELVDFPSLEKRLLATGHVRMIHWDAAGCEDEQVISLWFERGSQNPQWLDKDRVWAAWKALPDEEQSPVKRIARDLGLRNAEVAMIVYPVRQGMGAWKDEQEPDL